MLGVGEKFPTYSLSAVVSLEKGKEFVTIGSDSYPGKWKVYFFWPKDFTFVCPTEIAGFGKHDKDFQDRDAQLLGASIDSDFIFIFSAPPASTIPFARLPSLKTTLKGPSVLRLLIAFQETVIFPV